MRMGKDVFHVRAQLTEIAAALNHHHHIKQQGGWLEMYACISARRDGQRQTAIWL